MEFTLYTKREVAEAIKEIGKVPAYTTLWKQADFNLTDVPTRECLAFEQSKNVYGEVDPAYGKVKEYTELEGEELPGSGLSARQMARVINFLRKNGNSSLSNTQDMGNCQYAAVQRGTQLKREVTSMHLRRFIVMKMCKNPSFFSKYLCKSLATHYGLDRMSAKELAEKEKAGTISAQDAADQRLPGPFSFHSYLQHLNTDRTWGDVHTLTILSCIWQVGITVLFTDQLNEHRIRHDHKLKDADLVVVFTSGNHYMECSEYTLGYGIINCGHGMIKSSCGDMKYAHMLIHIYDVMASCLGPVNNF